MITQEWFDKEFSKEHKEIELEYEKYEDPRRQLVIEGYPQLEKLCLMDVESIDKIVLKNLTQLQECEIWGCGIKELTIKNCPQINKLDIQNNSLTTLEFLANLEKLERLKLDGNVDIENRLECLPESLKYFSYENTKLMETLKVYNGDWKSCQKDLQELISLARQNPYQLLKNIQNLKVEIKQLRENQPVTLDDSTESERKYKELKRVLAFLTKEEELKTEELEKIITDELVKDLTEQKKDLVRLHQANQELQEKLEVYEAVYDKIWQKQQELAEFKKVIIAANSEAKDDIEELLEAHVDNNLKWLEACKKRLIKQEVSEEEINLLCQKQELIVKLQHNINQREKQIYQIIASDGYNIIKAKALLDKSNEFLGAKRIFLNTRQGTIEQLQNCCDQLETKINIGKYAKREEIGNSIGALGKALNTVTLGLLEAAGEGMKVGNTFSKRKFLGESIKKFQEHLAMDGNSLTCFDQTYQSLISLIQENQKLAITHTIIGMLKLESRLTSQKTQLFAADYEVDQVINIWKGKAYLSPDDMKETINLLSVNLKKLRLELEQEERSFKKLATSLQEVKLETKIKIPPKE